MDCPLAPRLICGSKLRKINIFLIPTFLARISKMDPTGGDTFAVFSPYMNPTPIYTCLFFIILCLRFKKFWSISCITSRDSEILGKKYPKMNIPLGSKGTTWISFLLPTRGLDMVYKIIPYVKKSTYIPSCSIMTQLQEMVMKHCISCITDYLTDLRYQSWPDNNIYGQPLQF